MHHRQQFHKTHMATRGECVLLVGIVWEVLYEGCGLDCVGVSYWLGSVWEVLYEGCDLDCVSVSSWLGSVWEVLYEGCGLDCVGVSYRLDRPGRCYMRGVA